MLTKSLAWSEMSHLVKRKPMYLEQLALAFVLRSYRIHFQSDLLPFCADTDYFVAQVQFLLVRNPHALSQDVHKVQYGSLQKSAMLHIDWAGVTSIHDPEAAAEALPEKLVELASSFGTPSVWLPSLHSVQLRPFFQWQTRSCPRTILIARPLH
jgi:hypothetical protein